MGLRNQRRQAARRISRRSLRLSSRAGSINGAGLKTIPNATRGQSDHPLHARRSLNAKPGPDVLDRRDNAMPGSDDWAGRRSQVRLLKFRFGREPSELGVYLPALFDASRMSTREPVGLPPPHRKDVLSR
ncbi:MAG: hypothetical protein AMXMBFR58_30320 [Phycisphaerae bacterium]